MEWLKDLRNKVVGLDTAQNPRILVLSDLKK